MSDESQSADEASSDGPISKERVREAELFLFLRGSPVTQESLRKELGGGSFTTIKKHWDEVRKERANLYSKPHALLSEAMQHKVQVLTQQLFSALLEESEARVEAFKEGLTAELEKANVAVSLARDEHAAAEGRLQQLRERYDELQSQHVHVTREFTDLSAKCQVFEASAKDALQRSQESAQRLRQIETQSRVDLLAERDRAATERAALELRIAESQTALATEKERFSREEGKLSAQLEHHRFQHETLSGRVKVFEHERSALQTQLDRALTEKDGLALRLADEAHRILELKKEFGDSNSDLTQKLTKATEKIGQLEERLSSTNATLSKTQELLAARETDRKD